jgi:hypothetical protein
MNFRARPDMYVCFPKQPLAHYADNTMPRRDWSQYDIPTYLRKPATRERLEPILTIQRQAG